MDFVPATGRLAGEELAVDSIPQLLNQIRPFYQWIVFDLGRPTSRSMSLLYSFDKIFVVTTTALSALYEAKQLIGELKGAQVEERQLGLIINELVQAPSVVDREVRRTFGVRMCARLSSNYAELEKACLQQRLPHENSIVRKQIAALARTLAASPRRGPPTHGSFRLREKFAGVALVAPERRPREERHSSHEHERVNPIRDGDAPYRGCLRPHRAAAEAS